MFDFMLAYDHDDQDVRGWWISEKLDGVRAYWDGKQFWTRGGNIIDAPGWQFGMLRSMLPGVCLDGELWGGRGTFAQTNGACRMKYAENERYIKAWENISFQVFDAPAQTGAFEFRQAYLNSLDLPRSVSIVRQVKCEGDVLRDMLYDIQHGGGEGVILRAPGSPYVHGRSESMLRIKPDNNSFGTITGYVWGDGERTPADWVKSLVLRLDNGVTCKVGTGMSDRERSNPPVVGTRVVFRHKGRTAKGQPRHACEPCPW